jgi:hypothetical protein
MRFGLVSRDLWWLQDIEWFREYSHMNESAGLFVTLRHHVRNVGNDI